MNDADIQEYKDTQQPQPVQVVQHIERTPATLLDAENEEDDQAYDSRSTKEQSNSTRSSTTSAKYATPSSG